MIHRYNNELYEIIRTKDYPRAYKGDLVKQIEASQEYKSWLRDQEHIEALHAELRQIEADNFWKNFDSEVMA